MLPGDLSHILLFLQQAENLKSTLRTAHTTTGRHESTAEHSWRLCLMLLVFDSELTGMDRLRLLQMALIHDLAEAICGDVPAVSQHAGDSKTHMEKDAIEHITAQLPEEQRTLLLGLWEEYEAGQSAEACFLKGFDKLETILQHTQGKNPDDFDYAFNLQYGQAYMGAHPLLGLIRAELDKMTQAKMMTPVL